MPSYFFPPLSVVAVFGSGINITDPQHWKNAIIRAPTKKHIAGQQCCGFGYTFVGNGLRIPMLDNGLTTKIFGHYVSFHGEQGNITKKYYSVPSAGKSNLRIINRTLWSRNTTQLMK